MNIILLQLPGVAKHRTGPQNRYILSIETTVFVALVVSVPSVDSAE